MQSLVRVKMVVGLGAALFMAGSIHAQQNMASSPFSSSDSSIQQPAGDDRQSLAANGDFTSGTVMPDEVVVGPSTQAETELVRVMVTDTILLAIVLAGTVLIIAYTSVATRKRELPPAFGDRLRAISYGPAPNVSR